MKDQIACINAYIYALPSPWSIVFQLGRSCHYTTCRQHTDRQTDTLSHTLSMSVLWTKINCRKCYHDRLTGEAVGSYWCLHRPSINQLSIIIIILSTISTISSASTSCHLDMIWTLQHSTCHQPHQTTQHQPPSLPLPSPTPLSIS